MKTLWKQQIVPCKLNNDVLKLLFDMNKVVVRTWNFESFLLLVNRWKSQLQLKQSDTSDSKVDFKNFGSLNTIFREFDPGSGWTLAACLTHASRTELLWWSFRMDLKQLSGGRVSNAWVTCLTLGDNSQKWLLIPHKRTGLHDPVWKTPVVWDGPASD